MIQATTIKEISIPTERLDALMARIERINEKLKTSGAPLIQIEVLDQKMDKVKSGVAAGMVSMTKLQVIRHVESDKGQVRVLAVSHLNNLNNGFETHRFYDRLTDAQIDRVTSPEKSPNFCDHCETVRLRSKMYTVQVGDKISRVGTSCLDEFAGMKLMPWARAMEEADKALEQFSELSPEVMRRIVTVPVDLFLEEVFKIRENNASYDELVTHEYHRALATEAYLSASVKIQNDDEEPASEQIREKVAQVKQFIMRTEIDPEKRSIDYFLNLRNLLKHGYVSTGEIALLTSSIRSMERDIELKRKKEQNKNLGNRFVGEIKERLVLKNLIVESVYVKDGEYGYVTDIKFRDSENNFFSWRASGYFDLEVGSTVHLVGTVKNHEKWESKKYAKTIFDNQITRCKIMSEEEIDKQIQKAAKKREKKTTKNEASNICASM